MYFFMPHMKPIKWTMIMLMMMVTVIIMIIMMYQMKNKMYKKYTFKKIQMNKNKW